MTTTEQNNLLAHCKRCKRTARFTFARRDLGLDTMVAEIASALKHECCVEPMRNWFPWSFHWIVGTTTDGTCDSKCWSGTKAKCQCSCGGENHASNYTPEALLALGQMQ
jgi:hypothetical protein